MTKSLAAVLDVSPHALDIPGIDGNIGLMYTLFALEDLRGLQIAEIDREVCLQLDRSKGRTYYEMVKMLTAWLEQAEKL